VFAKDTGNRENRPPHVPPPPPPSVERDRPPQRPPQPRPQQSPNPGAAVVAGVVGVLLIALFIGVLANRGSHGSRNAGSSSSPSPTSETTSSDPSDEPSTSTSSSPTPTADPTFDAFDAVTVGDCLDAYQDPYDSSEWSEDEPNTVSCGSGSAYVEVYDIEDSSSGCDYEPLDGEDYWRSPTHDGETIYLCLRRKFRDGECFLGKKKSSDPGRVFITGHGLMTSWGCGKDTVPKGFNYILKFTGYYESRCPEDGSRKWSGFRRGVLCARVV
jgi:eukaryotic-like serine/threonine-protein kinase